MLTDKVNPDSTQQSKEGPEWRNHFIIGEARGCNAFFECAHCGKGGDKPWCTTSTRARNHLSGERGGVAACKKVPDAIRSLFKTASGSTVAATSLVQPTLDGGSQPHLAYKRHEDARAAEARCIYYNGISFNVVDSEPWRDMMHAAARAGATFKPVLRKALANSALEKDSSCVDKEVQALLKATKPYGYTINNSDGWTDVNLSLIHI